MSAIVAALRRALERELPEASPDGHRRVVDAVLAELGGAKVYVPRRVPGAAAARVAEALANGATVDQAAREAGVSTRHARRLRDDGQP